MKHSTTNIKLQRLYILYPVHLGGHLLRMLFSDDYPVVILCFVIDKVIEYCTKCVDESKGAYISIGALTVR